MSVVERIGSDVAWVHEPGDLYIITGTFPSGKRFPAITCKTWAYASQINLYRGTKWLLRDGVRYRLVNVRN